MRHVGAFTVEHMHGASSLVLIAVKSSVDCRGLLGLVAGSGCTSSGVMHAGVVQLGMNDQQS